MADNVQLNSGSGGQIIRALDDGTTVFPVGVAAFATSVGTPDAVSIVTPNTGLPVRLADGSGYLATLPVSLASVPSHAVTGPLTDTELRATAVPVSAASLPLPAGASTAAKQPAIGTAGTASADVLTVQGAAGMTPLLVNGSGVTQPVSDAGGSLTVDNAGTFAVQASQAGGWTVALGATDNAVLDDIAASLAGSLTVDDGGSSLTVDGTVTANAGTGTFAVSAASLPLPAGAATLAEQQSQTTQLTRLGLKYLDYDTGAGTDSAVAFGILLPGNGGSVVGGTSSNPIRTDPTGSTTQPVSGTVTANLGTIGGAATEASLASLNAKVTAVNTGAVVVTTLPALPAGTNNIGDVDVLTLPALAAGDNAVGRVKLTDGTDVADILSLMNAKPLTVAIVDGSGDQITSFGGGSGGTEYTEGATDASITGTAFLWEDAGDTLRAVSAAKPLPIGDAGGSLTVDNGGTFAVQAAQSGTWTVTGAGGSFPVTDSGGSLTVDNADLTAAAGSLNVMDDWDESDRAKVNPIVGQAGVQGGSGAVSANTQRVVLATDVALPTGANVIGAVTQSGTWTVTGAGGSFPVTDSGGTLTVDAPVGTPVFVRLSDGSSAISTLPVSLASVPSHAVTNAGTFATQVDGAALTALQLIDNPVVVDDAAFTPATTSVMMAGFTFDNVTPDSVNEGDAGAARMSANRCIFVNIRDNAGNERGLNIDASGQLAVTLASAQTLATVTTVSTVTAVSTLTGGGIAHDSADSGNPHKIGGKAKSSLSAITLVSADDRTDLFADVDGVLLVRQDAPLADNLSGVASITDGSSTSVIAAQGSGVKTYITDVTISNTSATAVTVDLRDGTAGSVKWTFPVPANTAGVVHSFRRPLGFSANTAVAADPSASASTITVSLGGFRSKV